MDTVLSWLGGAMRASRADVAGFISTVIDLVTAKLAPTRFRARQRERYSVRRKRMRSLVHEVASHRSGTNRDRGTPQA